MVLEQPRRDHVDALVGALRREDCRNKQLKGIRMLQRALRIRVSLPETFEDFLDTRGIVLACRTSLWLRRCSCAHCSISPLPHGGGSDCLAAVSPGYRVRPSRPSIGR